MNAARIPDLDDRTRAATVFDRPITIEAGAGTGKTTLLIHRLLVWALDTGWRQTVAEGDAKEPERIASRLLDRVVAITFTEAAAAELAERFVDAIAGAAHGDLPTGFDREWLSIDEATLEYRARWLLPQVDRAHITTIHAWCYDLLRRHPHAAGVHPELEIVADAQQIEAIAREVVEAHYRRAYQHDHDTDLVLLGEEKLGPSDWVELVRLWVVAGWGVDAHLPDDDGVAAYVDEVRSAAAALVKVTPMELAQLSGRNLGPLVLEAAGTTANEASGGPEAALAGLVKLWADNLRTHLRKWAKADFNKTEQSVIDTAQQKAIADSAAALAPLLAILKQIDPVRWGRRQRVLKAAILDTEAALHEASAITFGGLLRQASSLLEGDAEVTAAERARIDLLLVDEFQDTDALQAKLVEALALTDAAIHSQTAPSLIVVGDPKQSIYGWRNADLETYERIRCRVLERGGLELVLSSNFRSTTAVLAATDAIVGGQMHPDPGFQPRYQELAAAADHAADESAPIEIQRFNTDSAAEEARCEAEWVARDLAQRRRNGECTWNEAAILIRSKTHVRAILRALRAQGIPYEMSADVGFHERSEVIDAAAWVRVIADPNDDVALLTVLRSPTVGLPDAALPGAWKPLHEQIQNFSRPNAEAEVAIKRTLEESLDGVTGVPGIERIDGWVDHAAASLGHIGRLRQDLRRRPFAEFIDRLRHATDIEAIEARRPEGEARVANLVKLFDQLSQQVEDTGGDTHAVLRVLRRGIYFEFPAEEAVPLKPIDGAVQVATIHAAKGLEFDHLYLVHFGMGGGADQNELQVEAAIPGATLIKRVAHPKWALGRQRRQRVGEGEALRLLYVALTRARLRLTICLPQKSNAGTLGYLLDSGLKIADSDRLMQVLAEHAATEDASSPPGGRPPAAGDPLPNPEWLPPPDPARLHDSPTRVGEGLASSPARSPSAPVGEDLASSRDRSPTQRGNTIHRLLAEMDLAVAQPDLPARFRDHDAREFWATFPDTATGRRLLSLGDRLRGREVEVLTPATLLAGSQAAYAGGKIDLIYVDELDGDASPASWVIADYKTGEPDDLAATVESYAPQLRYYGRALTEALSLEPPPRLELWFVDLDRIVAVDPGS